MRKPIKSSRGGLVSRTATVPAPVKGINARDSLASMDDEDAVYMVNWWPQPSYIGIRRGYRQHVTGFADPVESLCAYNTATGTSLFAASGTAIYDATTAGTVGAAVCPA
jgi:subtilase family serine protease